MKHLLRAGLGVVVAAGMAQCAAGQARPYPSGDVKKTYERLLKQIEAIPMYDNHSHAGFADDPDVDAMASPPDESATLRLREDNPELVAAAKALFAYPYGDFKPEHAKWLADKARAAEQTGGVAYFDGILDKLNVDICLANRAMMAPYLDPKRFHWVFFGDSFFFPFDNTQQTKQHAGHGRLCSVAGKDAGPMEETRGRRRPAGGSGRVRRFRAPHHGR